MHETSTLWKQLFSEPDHRKEWKVSVNGIEYPQNRIVSAPHISGKLFDTPSVGNCNARTVELGLIPYSGTRIEPLSVIRLFVRLVSVDGQRASEYIPKGVFYADTVTYDSIPGTATISGYDAIMKMELSFGTPISGSGESGLNRACDITFKDGIGGTQTFTRRVGDVMPTPTIPTRTGYTFTAWSPPLPGTVTRDATYTAQWTPTLQIYINSNDVLVVEGVDASISGDSLSIVSDDVSVSGNIFQSDCGRIT